MIKLAIILLLSCPSLVLGDWTATNSYINAYDPLAVVNGNYNRDADPTIYKGGSTLPNPWCPSVTYFYLDGPKKTFTATGSDCFNTTGWSNNWFRLSTPVSYSSGTWMFNVQRAVCDLPAQDTSIYYGSDGLACFTSSLDVGLCAYTEIELPDASACCSNDIKDGMEWAMDQGGACDDIKGNTCPAGQVLFTSNGGNWCGKPNNIPESECGGVAGPEWGFPTFWSITSSQCLEISAKMPIYTPPVEATDLIAGVNDTNKILSDSINAANSNADAIVRAINISTDVGNTNSKSIVSAIVDSKSAIVAAINSKDFAPVINVAAPSVSVSSPSVTVDTSSTNAAITAAASQAGQDSAALGNKVDALTAAILGQVPGGAADMSGVESRLDALNAKHVSPVVDPLGLVVSPLLAPGLSDRFRDRFDLFAGRLESAPVFSALGNVMDFPAGGGAPSTSISMGSYGSFTMDFSPMAAGLGIFGKLAIAASFLVSLRLILANK